MSWFNNIFGFLGKKFSSSNDVLEELNFVDIINELEGVSLTVKRKAIDLLLSFPEYTDLIDLETGITVRDQVHTIENFDSPQKALNIYWERETFIINVEITELGFRYIWTHGEYTNEMLFDLESTEVFIFRSGILEDLKKFKQL
jgi:hypothetical protein